jgi:hypothetical protein
LINISSKSAAMQRSISVFKSPEYKAYTQLTIVARVKQNVENGKKLGQSSMSFDEFKKIIADCKITSNSNSRKISCFHSEHIQTQLRFKPDESNLYENVARIIEKAYEKGLVNEDETLISSAEWRA